MANIKKKSVRSIAALVDDLDRTREELLKVQRSLEKIDPSRYVVNRFNGESAYQQHKKLGRKR